MAPPNTQQRNQSRKKEEESDAFMRLVNKTNIHAFVMRKH